MAKSKPETEHRPSAVPTTKEKQDEAIIGTNDYSIVSKRSVEKLYCSNEPEFLRPFVGKYKRRAPLINRGYWLRMRAIENAVKSFLHEETGKGKVVVNLGCGYEPLPFRMLWKYSSQCRNVKFVDVDYPQLMKKKVDVIWKNNMFSDLLSSHSSRDGVSPSPEIMLRDEQYCAVGCDLGNVKSLDQIFRTELQLENHSILFVGEVSIVYMEVQKADDLIAWASKFSDARICLLEQHLPEGTDHPFAKTMLEHFQKQTPLRCLATYNTMQDQHQRFRKAGWPTVKVKDLWSLWQDGDIDLAERLSLESTEPFDEWEELALFAGHYFRLTATTAMPTLNQGEENSPPKPAGLKILDQMPIQISIRSEENPRGQGLRRFGAAINIGENAVAFHGGLTSTARQGDFDVYCKSTRLFVPITPLPEGILCHTLTALQDGTMLLVGGRHSPARASSSCWIRVNTSWRPTHELTPARYRHCSVAVRIGSTSGVLTFGGRTSTGGVLDEWSLFDMEHGWRTIKRSGLHPPGLFGAGIAATGDGSGILIGGMTAGGAMSPQYWEWNLTCEGDGLCINFSSRLPNFAQRGLNESDVTRYGATLAHSQWGLLLIGGVGIRGPLSLSEEVVLVSSDGMTERLGHILINEIPRPLLVGVGAATVDDGKVLIVGGSAVCFSFGAFWNARSYLLYSTNDSSAASAWTLSPPADANLNSTLQEEATQDGNFVLDQPVQQLQETQALAHAAPIPHIDVPTADSFQALIRSAKPAVIRNLCLGPCTKHWTPPYLVSKIGPTTPITIHSAAMPHLSFHPKNFSYETVPFGTFIESATSGSHVYLRALAFTTPNKLPANLSRDFPGIADDVHVPDQLAYVAEHEHSSVLRISGDIAMWLHYDVMANVLCQIKGSKRVVLFPPGDVSHLQFPAGETTSNLQVFTAGDGSLNDTHPVETILHEGEVLFIPACWPHATAAAGDGISVAVNIFFRSLGGGYAAGRDVYGNRDLEAYQNGRRDVGRVIEMFQKCQRADARPDIASLAEALRRGVKSDGRGSREVERVLKSLEALPADIAQFYRLRLADELVEGAS